jgi:putative membrane protein
MMMGGIGVVGMFIWIIILGFLIYGVYVLVTKGRGKKEDQALNILKERYANGEISEEEYEKGKVQLTKD